MGISNLLQFCLIGIASGWLAGQILKTGGKSLITDMIIGVIGAAVGGLLFGLLGLKSYGLIGSLVTATVGSVVLLVALKRLNKS